VSTKFSIGADVGTSGLKASLYHLDRGVVGVAESRYEMHRPVAGWAENDPRDWRAALRLAIAELLATTAVRAADVGSLCVVGQRDIAVLLDRNGDVLAPCIHWTDKRAPAETNELFTTLGRDWLYSLSATQPIPGLVLANLGWTQRHEPEIWNQVRLILQPKDYVCSMLHPVAATDPTSPTRSLLNDWRTQSWSEEICTAAGVPIGALPDVSLQPWDACGVLGSREAAAVGLAPGTILAGGGGDDPASALGAGVVNLGDLSVGTGSSMSWRTVVREPMLDPAGIIGLAPHVVPERLIREMVVVGSGTTFRWLRGLLGGGRSYADLIAEADTVDAGSDGLMCFPYLDGASVPPHEGQIRAVFAGIDGHHIRPHFVRALLEGVAYQYPELADMMKADGRPAARIVISDGEARSAVWNQIKADVLGVPVHPAPFAEAPAVGAALLAATAAGTLSCVVDGLETLNRPLEVVEPDPIRHARYQELRRHWLLMREHAFELQPGTDTAG
jgi:xylulokinase